MPEGYSQFYGLGKGNAQVWPDSGNVRLFGQLVAKKQAERDAEQKAIASRLASMNTAGLRQRDQQKYYGLFDDWRTTEQKSYGLKGQDKFNAQAESAKKEQQLKEFVAASKAKAARDATMGTQILNKPHIFNKEGKLLYQKSADAETGSVDDIIDFTQIPMGHDMSKVNATINALDDQVMQASSRYNNDAGTNDGKGTITYKRVRTGDPKAQAFQYASLYDTDDAFKAFVEESYPTLDWDGNEAQAKQVAIQDLIAKRPLVREEAPVMRTDPDYIDKAEAERLRLARTREARQVEKGKETTSADVRREWIQNIKDWTPNALEKLVAAGNANSEYDKEDKFNIFKSGNKVMLHVPSKIKTSADGATQVVIPAHNYDINHKDPNFETYMNQIIGDVTGAHVDLGSLGAKSANLKKSPPSTKVVVKETAQSKKLEGTSEQLKAAADKKGMSKDEYKKFLQSQGYTVIEK